MRDRTWVGESGRQAYDGTDMIGRIWDRALGRLARRRAASSAVSRSMPRRARARPLGRLSRPRAPTSCRPSSTHLGAERHRTTAGPAMKFGIFYEHQLPRPWDRGSRAPAHPGRARPGRAGRPARHRVRVGGRAPLPRGVLALVGARGVPRRCQPAHQEHPPRPRHHPDRARLQPPGPHRRAGRDARPRVERAGRLRLGRVVVARPSWAASTSTR